MRPWAASIWIVPVLAVSLAAAAPAASLTATGADGLRYAQLIRQDNFDPDAIAIIPADGPLEVVFEWFPEDAENDGDDFGFGEGGGEQNDLSAVALTQQAGARGNGQISVHHYLDGAGAVVFGQADVEHRIVGQNRSDADHHRIVLRAQTMNVFAGEFAGYPA